MKKPLRHLRVSRLNSNLSKRITDIVKRLYGTIESKLNTLIYRLLDLPEDGCWNAEIQTPAPSLSREEIDKLLFEAQQRSLEFEAQIKSFNAAIDDFRRAVEECMRRYKPVLPEK